MTLRRILITPGEPAGIGPDITVQIAQKDWSEELIAIANPNLLIQRAKRLGLPLQLIETDLSETPSRHQPSTLKIFPIPLKGEVEPGALNKEHARYVIQTLETAARFCTEKKAKALVTGPVHKGIINEAGIRFSGHTEFFAQYCGVPQTVMLFVIADLKVALVTTHIPLAAVPKAITAERLKATLAVLRAGLKRQFHLANPRIGVCGLNPHAGEGGYLGREEIETIIPTLNELRKQGYEITGPLAADTIFTPQSLKNVDIVLAMYHDQALPVVKTLGFHNAVNVTLGLPFVRTSVDHGTALDVAGTHHADPNSLVSAIELATKLD